MHKRHKRHKWHKHHKTHKLSAAEQARLHALAEKSFLLAEAVTALAILANEPVPPGGQSAAP